MGHRRAATPERGTFASLTNALEFQFEQGADPETVRHLLHALLAFTRSTGLDPAVLKLAADAEHGGVVARRREVLLVADPTLPAGEIADDHPERCRVDRIGTEEVLRAVGELLGEGMERRSDEATK